MIDVIHKIKNGNFIHKNLTLTPYQHYRNKMIWEVTVSDKGENDHYSLCKIRIVASSVENAVKGAISLYPQKLEEEKKIKQVEREIKNERLRATKSEDQSHGFGTEGIAFSGI